MALRRKRQYVVAIGASAGGLEALLELLPQLRGDGTTRFILAQHMSRNGHTELVVRVLSRHAQLPVVQATDGMPVLPDRVHVIPAGSDGYYEDGCIHLREPSGGHHSVPSVNALFSSVARAAGDDAVAVVLSGAGSDGLIGAREVRKRGGTVLVQEPTTSAIHGMAGAVQREGLADAVMAPLALAHHLNALDPKPSVRSLPVAPLAQSAPLDLLLRRLSEHAGVDFAQYRHGTLLRRMDRRREHLRMATLDEYIAHALDTPAELDVLHRMFMISWSWFYRDAAAWDRLTVALRQSLDAKPTGEPFVAWVPGCASGEEAHTLAMLLRWLDPSRPVRIIASDISAEAIANARIGRYTHNAMRELPRVLRERFVTERADEARVHDDIRALCEFHVEDALTSAPDELLDLVSCRNLLIYMRRELQDPLLQRAHDLLRPGGLLFLGLSESLTRPESTRYRVEDATLRIYRRRTDE